MGIRGRKSASELATLRPAPVRVVHRIVAPPRELDAAGQAIWNRMVAAYDFSAPAGAEILFQACAAADLAEQTDDAKLALQCRAFVARTLGRLCE